MDDLDDVFEAFDEIEEIAEELAEPDELLEDFAVNPLAIVAGLVAAFVGLVTLLLLLLTLVLFAFAFGFVWVVAVLTFLGFLATILAVGAFLSVRSDIPSDVRHQIGEALRQADDTPAEDAGMTEQEAITELKDMYADGEINEHELERGLDDIFTSDQPETVIERYEQRETTQSAY